MKTKVINETGNSIILKEGTAGVFRHLRTLADKEAYNINVDTNATYREYWCAVKANDPNAIILSSDDCQEYKEVTFVKKDNGTYGFDPKPRHGAKAKGVEDAGVKGQNAEEESNIFAHARMGFKKFLGFFKQGNSQL